MKTNLRNWLLLSILAVFTLSLASCSKDDEENFDGSIVGIWKVEEYALDGAKTPIAPENPSYSEFKNKGTVVTYELDEDGKTFFAYPPEPYSYDSEKHLLTIGDETVKVLKLTQSTMIVDGQITYGDTHIKRMLTMTLKRVSKVGKK